MDEFDAKSKALTQTDIESRRTKKKEIRDKHKKFNDNNQDVHSIKLFN